MATSPIPYIINALIVLILLIPNIVKVILMPFYRALYAETLPLVVRTPEERFKGLAELGYDFKANYFDIPAGGGVSLVRMHYVDEGPRKAAKTILCLHGEPTWSFLYRHMVPILTRAGYRVVVPDFIGFGKSDKFTSMDNYTMEMHMASIRMLIEHLDLKNIVLVCQDWGGLTGLPVVKDMPDRFSDLVIMNTGLPDGNATPKRIRLKDVPKIASVGFFDNIRLRIGFLAWLSIAHLSGTRMPVGRIVRAECGCSTRIARAYDAPFPGYEFKAGAAKWPLLVSQFPDEAAVPHFMEARTCLERWTKPVLVMFGSRDYITGHFSRYFKGVVRHAVEMPIKGASHFLQETHGEILAKNIIEFLKAK